MYARLVPKLRDMGWQSLIPLKVGLKAPAITVWERFNVAPPTPRQIIEWCHVFSNGGIGLAFGPDQTIAVDLDFLDPEKAATARANMITAFGETPLIRIGQAPKMMGFYRSGPGLNVEGRAFGGFELYSKSGQVVLYGIHEKTQQPYVWPEESPEHVSPEDLPVMKQDQLEHFLTRMEPLREDKVVIRGATVTNTGRTAEWLRLFAGMSVAEMIDAVCVGIRGVGPGSRHFTMQAGVTALTTKAIPTADFIDEVTEAYASTLDQAEARARAGAVLAVACWAEKKVWGGTNIKPVKLAPWEPR